MRTIFLLLFSSALIFNFSLKAQEASTSTLQQKGKSLTQGDKTTSSAKHSRADSKKEFVYLYDTRLSDKENRKKQNDYKNTLYQFSNSNSFVIKTGSYYLNLYSAVTYMLQLVNQKETIVRPTTLYPLFDLLLNHSVIDLKYSKKNAHEIDAIANLSSLLVTLTENVLNGLYTSELDNFSKHNPSLNTRVVRVRNALHNAIVSARSMAALLVNNRSNDKVLNFIADMSNNLDLQLWALDLYTAVHHPKRSDHISRINSFCTEINKYIAKFSNDETNNAKQNTIKGQTIIVAKNANSELSTSSTHAESTRDGSQQTNTPNDILSSNE